MATGVERKTEVAESYRQGNHLNLEFVAQEQKRREIRTGTDEPVVTGGRAQFRDV